MVEETLQELGLSKRESICYTSLLELGSSKIGAITKKTGIPSSKIYEILENLIRRGFVSYVTIGKIKHFQASEPSVLLNFIDEKKKKIEEIIPQLLLSKKLSTTQSVEMFSGQRAIFSLFTNLIRDAKVNEKYLVFSIDEENKNDEANLFFKNLAVRRKDKKLQVQLLKNKKYFNQEKHTKLKIKFTDFNLPQGITIFRNIVIILSWSQTPVAIKIENETIAAQMKTFFDEQWTIAK